MPSLAELEQWMEEQIPDNLHDLPTRLHATVQAYSAQLYEQLLDLTPSLSQIESSLPNIPFVNAAQPQAAAAPPPPAPLVASWIDGIATRLDAITGTRRRTSVLSGIALAGLTYALVHRSIRIRRARIAHEGELRIPRSRNGARSDAVIVLGADTPLGQSLSHALASQGFIVMASVSNEQSKQTFDSLVPPSMRGYIKTIVLPSYETQTEHITQFARTINAARQLRWPLTAAGDPYARKGSEIDIVAVVNALSYRSPLDHSIQASSSASASGAPNRPSSPFKLDVDGLSSELQSRVVTPLATMRALVPLMATSSADAQGPRAPSPAILISLAHPTGASDVASQALLSGMQAIAQSSAASDGSYPPKRRRASRAFVGANTAAGKPIPSVITLEARPSTVSNLFASLVPHFLGGRAISTVPWSRTIGGSFLAARQDAPWYSLPSRTLSNPFISERTSSSSTTTPTRAKRASSSASSQTSEIRVARTEEHRTVIQATLKLLVETSLHPHSMQSRYYVRLPAVYLPVSSHVSADEQNASSSLSRSNQDPARASMHIESTVLVRTLHTLSAPFYVISQALSELASVVLPFRPSSGYSGTRNTFNSRPAYGPGPGPASNTHSRSCIRHYDAPGSSPSNAKEQTKGSSATMNASSSQRRNRPLSTASTGSSDHARSSESENARESGGASFASGNASSGPPSNHDMSSSGLLSSVPSSAFGDASEEEHYNDSDFIEGTESPVLGGGRSTTGAFASERWQSQSQTSSDASAEATYTQSSSMSDDQDDSGTALGARNAQGTYTLSTDETPHASRFGSETDGLPYGFPSHASMQTAEERPWMGPQEDVAAQDQAGTGTQSPLGQSWVALGQSSTQDQAQA